jgi:menaquinol-cytochrome c reductase iron-sulfur subunit
MTDETRERQEEGAGFLNGKIKRRSFLEMVIFSLVGLCSLLVSVPVVGFVFEPLFHALHPVWRPVGKVDSFRIGETVAVQFQDASPLEWAGMAAESAAWLRRESKDSFIAFAVNCSHLGCPVQWKGDAQLFMCPCHGGVYYKDGSVAAGPPPRPLSRYSVRLRDGMVEIQTAPVVIQHS